MQKHNINLNWDDVNRQKDRRGDSFYLIAKPGRPHNMLKSYLLERETQTL